MKGLKENTIRGGLAKVGAQAATFSLRFGSLMVLARLLDPRDFGLVGMVTAFTGILNLFRDFGLSAAAVQRLKVTEEQVSTLFWINLLVGAALTLLVVAMAPFIAAFYHEPRLIWVTVVLASGFIVNAAGVQHSSLLQRQMRFTTMAGIDVLSLAVSIMTGIAMALRGFGYWSLVATALVPTLVTTTCLWIAAAWIPGKPRRGTGLRSMLRFGGTLTLNGVVVYIAYNLDKVLLGRWWGAQAVGLYGRAYTLINIPTENLNTAAGEVAFPALSRVQDDPVRLKRYFLKGYSLVLALTVPITIACALFANDLIPVVLGPKWHQAIPIFRLLSPTILILAFINPLIWLVLSLGMVGRSLRVGLVYAPIVIAGCVAGLPYGPTGVAIGYSTVLTLWFIPHIAWCVHGTVVSLRDILYTASRPLLCGLTGAAVAFGLQFFYETRLSALPRLVLGCAILFGVYLAMLLYGMGQKAFYLDLLRTMKDVPREEKNIPASWQPDLQQTTVQQALGAAQPSGEEHKPATDVLFIASDYKPNPGGIAAYLDSLVRGLITLGNNVKVLSLVESKEKERLTFLRTYEKWVIPLEVAHDQRPESWLGNKCVSLLEIGRCASPRARKWLDKTSWFKTSSESLDLIKGVLEKEKPALVVMGHLDLKLYPLVLYLRENRLPYGIIAHDAEIYFSAHRLNDRVRRGMMVKGAKWIAANSRHTKSLVEAWGIAPEKIMIVHPPLSEQAINVSHELPRTAKSRVYTLVTVSRIVHNKGIDIVLRALKILDRNHVPYRYVIAGEGPERVSLENLTVELGMQEKVHFASSVSEEDKWRLLQSSDVFVMPSRVNPREQHEGFGIAFLEAAACSIPAIGSNAGGIPDAVVDGETGILVEPESPEKLADALMFLYLNPEKRKEMGKAGMERARSQFSPRAIAAHFQQEISLRS
jgi:O-antigen/teichoic acid export membrane protein/glycosyltransferase involved in cell wall biosynthesis